MEDLTTGVLLYFRKITIEKIVVTNPKQAKAIATIASVSVQWTNSIGRGKQTAIVLVKFIHIVSTMLTCLIQIGNETQRTFLARLRIGTFVQNLTSRTRNANPATPFVFTSFLNILKTYEIKLFTMLICDETKNTTKLILINVVDTTFLYLSQ